MAREILFEFHRVGGSVRVSAIDPASGLEVSVVGPVQASEQDLKRLALRKLEYVQNKQATK